MQLLVTSAIALAAMMAWVPAMAVDVHILGFRFDCETPDGEMRKPKFGDVGGMFFTNLPEERKPCHETIDRMIYSCTANTTFISHELNREYASCLPVFEKQAQECVSHFEGERTKCNAGGDSVNQEVQASDTRPIEDNARDTGEDGSSAGDAWKPWEDNAVSDASEGENWVDVAVLNEGYEPDDGDYGECDDVEDDCPVDTYWTEEQQEGARQIELWVNFADPQANVGTGPEDEGWEHEKYDAAVENGDAADSDDVNREAHASDTQPVENDAWDNGEDGSSAGDVWKPWQDEAASDASEDEHWVNVADLNEGYEPDDGDYGECKDVWDDCPVDTYWTKEQQEGARQIELWVNFADPNANARTSPEAEGWRNESYDTTGENRDTADSAREVYDRALAGLLNEDGSSTAHLYSAPAEDYLAVLKKMDVQAKEKARIEAEKKARIEAEKAAAEAAAQQELQEAEGDGSCGSAPASRNYIRHGEQVIAQVNHLSTTSMTDDALLAAFATRSTLGCLKKSLPYETNTCKTMLQSAISEFENTYRSAIASAKGSAAASSYVDEFDRDPGSSQFVRNLGIHISGASLDSCGD